MLQSYEAICDHGKLLWLGDRPGDEELRVIVTVLPGKTASVSRDFQKPSARIAGKGRILGDIIASAASVSDWNCEK
jgi:hypothetical protein